MVLWITSGYAPQDLNPWKSPLCSLYCFQKPGAKVRGGSSDADYLILDCNKKMVGKPPTSTARSFYQSFWEPKCHELIYPPQSSLYLPLYGWRTKWKWALGNKITYSRWSAGPAALLLAFKPGTCWEQSHPTFLLFSEMNTPRSWCLWGCFFVEDGSSSGCMGGAGDNSASSETLSNTFIMILIAIPNCAIQSQIRI